MLPDTTIDRLRAFRRIRVALIERNVPAAVADDLAIGYVHMAQSCLRVEYNESRGAGASQDARERAALGYFFEMLRTDVAVPALLESAST